jgi:hypothetical protein
MPDSGLNIVGRKWGGSRWAGRLAVPENAHPLVKHLFQIMNREKVCMREAARGTGVSFATVSDWRYRRNPYLPSIEAVGNRLGYELVWRKRGE